MVEKNTHVSGKIRSIVVVMLKNFASPQTSLESLMSRKGGCEPPLYQKRSNRLELGLNSGPGDSQGTGKIPKLKLQPLESRHHFSISFKAKKSSQNRFQHFKIKKKKTVRKIGFFQEITVQKLTQNFGRFFDLSRCRLSWRSV